MTDANQSTTTNLPVPANLTPGNTVIIDTNHIYQHPSNNPRTSYSDENWDRLVNDLRTLGQLFPVTARLRCEHDGPDTEGYLLIMEDGHSRAKARREMGVDRDETGRRADDLSVTIKPSIEDRVLARLQAESQGLEPSEVAGVKAKLVKEEKAKVSRESHSVNTARESWNSWAEANSLHSQLVIQRDLNPDLDEKGLEDLVGEINGMKGDLVRMRLSLLEASKTPKDIQEKLKAGELSYSEAIELRRITDQEIREDLADKSYTEGWSANMLKKKIDAKVKEAAADGKTIKSSRKRSTPKKQVSNLRSEDNLSEILGAVKEAIEDVAEEEDELLNQLLGAVAALEYVMTPNAEEDFLAMLDAYIETYFDEDDEQESETDSQEDVLAPFNTTED